MVRLVCAHCKNPYYADRKGNRSMYCGLNCKQAAYRERVRYNRERALILGDKNCLEAIRELLQFSTHRNLMLGEIVANLVYVPHMHRVKALHHMRNAIVEVKEWATGDDGEIPF